VSDIREEAERVVITQTGEGEVPGDLINMCKNLMRVIKKYIVRPFSLVPTDRMRGNERTLKKQIFCRKNENFFHCEGDQTLEPVTQSSCKVSILRDIQNLCGYSPEQPAIPLPSLCWCVVLGIPQPRASDTSVGM